jgi:hypothetical protein
MSEWKGDDFVEQHLRAWLTTQFPVTGIREKAEAKIRAFLTLHDDVIQRNWTWREILDQSEKIEKGKV